MCWEWEQPPRAHTHIRACFSSNGFTGKTLPCSPRSFHILQLFSPNLPFIHSPTPPPPSLLPVDYSTSSHQHISSRLVMWVIGLVKHWHLVIILVMRARQMTIKLLMKWFGKGNASRWVKNSKWASIHLFSASFYTLTIAKINIFVMRTTQIGFSCPKASNDFVKLHTNITHIS